MVSISARARARKADEEDRRGPLVSAGDAFPAGHPLTREVGAVAAQSLHVALGICTLRLGKLRLPRIGATESGEGRVRIAQAIIGLTKLELGVRRDRRAGPAGQELLQPRPRFLEPSRAVVEDGRNQVADGVAGALSQHAPGHLPRLVERVHGLERDGQRGRPIERVRAERDGSAQQVDRFLRPALEPQHPAQVVERAKMVGIERQGPVICVLGRLVPPVRVKRDGPVEVGPNAGGIQLGGAAKCRFGLPGRARGHEGVAEVVVIGGLVRLGRDRLLDEIDRRGSVAALQLYDAQKMERVGVLGLFGKDAPIDRLGRRRLAGTVQLARLIEALLAQLLLVHGQGPYRTPDGPQACQTSWRNPSLPDLRSAPAAWPTADRRRLDRGANRRHRPGARH